MDLNGLIKFKDTQIPQTSASTYIELPIPGRLQLHTSVDSWAHGQFLPIHRLEKQK